MLITCKECELPVSDKAISCPHCGYPLKSSHRTSKTPKRMRLPNGFGQISELKGRNLRKPYRAMVTVGKNHVGRPICKILSYHESYNAAYAALVEYNKNPYDLDTCMTVSEVYEKWTDKYFEDIGDSSKRTITSAWAYCKEVYDLNINDLRARHIKCCMDSVNSWNIKSRIKSLFNLMLDYALEYELVDKNYARTFKLEKNIIDTKKDHIAFTNDEMKVLWNNTSIPLVNVILLQCYTGWRPQELCNIKRSDVNIIDMTMTGGMKTDAGRERIVPIPPKAQDLAKKLDGLSELLKSEYFICDLDGSHMTYDKYNKRFHKIIDELKLNVAHRPHDPRKTYITMCKNTGVDEYAIKKLVGHQIDDITEKIYTERKFDWLVNEVKKLED